MKRHNLLNAFLIASVLSTVAMTAIAGPQPIEKTVAPAPPSEIDWAGPYIGFNVGVVWTNYDVSKYRTDVDFEDQFYEVVSATGQFTGIATFPFDGHSATESNAIGGGQLGYNLQFGHFVVGAEGGFSGAGSERSRRSEQFQINPLFEVIGIPLIAPGIDKLERIHRRSARLCLVATSFLWERRRCLYRSACHGCRPSPHRFL